MERWGTLEAMGEHSATAPPEDTRLWQGRLQPGHEADHAAFVEWLRSSEAEELFRRRRLTEYVLRQDGPEITVVFRAPHTGDPRLVIDFLRYPGLWPEYWQFERAGGEADVAALEDRGEVRVHWRRAADPATPEPRMV